MEQENGSGKKPDVSMLKLALDMGPLLIFGGIYYGTYYIGFKGDSATAGVTPMVYATVALMIATAISLTANRILLKRIPVMALVTGVFLVIFGGLTIYLQDQKYLMMKPTIVSLLLACALAGGLFFRKLLLKTVLSEALQMHDEGWRLLTQRWIGYLVVFALMNEVVRRYYPDAWVAFKLAGVFLLPVVFMASQISLIMKYQTPEVSSGKQEASST